LLFATSQAAEGAPKRVIQEAIGAARSAQPDPQAWSPLQIVCPESTLQCHVDTTQPNNVALASIVSSLKEGCAVVDRSDCAVRLLHIETTDDGHKRAQIAFSTPPHQSEAAPVPALAPLSSEPIVRGVLATVRSTLHRSIVDDFTVRCLSEGCVIHTRQAVNSQLADILSALETTCAQLTEAPCQASLRTVETTTHDSPKVAQFELRPR